MRKLLSVGMILGLAVILTAGCQQAQQPAPTLDAATAAVAVGQLVTNSIKINESLLGVGAIGSSAPSIKTLTVPSLEAEADGWWRVTYTASFGAYSQSLDIHFKAWDRNGNLLDTGTKLDEVGTTRTLDKLHSYGSITSSSAGTDAYIITLGNGKTDPLKMEGLSGTSQTIDGSVSYSATTDGETLTVNMTFNNISTASGYPNGTVNFSISYAGTTYAGTITFNGTSTASIAFTQGLTGSYTVDLDSGQVVATAASL